MYLLPEAVVALAVPHGRIQTIFSFSCFCLGHGYHQTLREGTNHLLPDLHRRQKIEAPEAETGAGLGDRVDLAEGRCLSQEVLV